MSFATWDELRSLRRGVLGKPYDYTMRSWIPEKYILLDLETGETWRFMVVGTTVTAIPPPAYKGPAVG